MTSLEGESAGARASAERVAAWADVHDPATSGALLAEIAGQHPEFAAAIVAHPNCYPGLAAWARSLALVSGEPEDRAAGESQTDVPRQSDPAPDPSPAEFVPPVLVTSNVVSLEWSLPPAVPTVAVVSAALTATPSQRPDPSSVPVAGRVDLGVALRYGWRRFSANPSPFLLILLISGASAVLSYLVVFAFFGALLIAASGSGTFGLSVGLFLLSAAPFVPTFVGLIMSMGLLRASIDTVRGLPVTVKSALRRDGLGQYLAFWGILVVGVLAFTIALAFLKTIGTIILFLVAVAASVLTFFAPYLILDRRMSAMDAMRTSCAMATANMRQTFVNVLVIGVVSGAGALLCGLGAFVTAPLAMIAAASMYLSARGENSAP